MKTDGNALISNLFLSADAGFQEHATEWGKGGPIVEAGRLNLSETDEDHRGFHIYEWYNAVVGSVLGRPIPMILMEVGRWSSETGPFDLIPAQSKKRLNRSVETYNSAPYFSFFIANRTVEVFA